MKIKFGWMDVLIIVLFLLFVYFILTRIFGHSASDIAITVALFSLLSSLMFRLIFVVFNLNREFGESKIRTINSFSKMGEDINLIKKKLKV